MAKRKKWIKPRHRVIKAIAKAVLWPVCKLKYGIEIEKFKEEEDRPYLILYNHQTAFDQFFMGISFKKPIYYVATEDIFSMGFVSSLLRFAVEPIPIKKQATDVGAVMNCIRVAKEGGTICIAPEGNRTYSGKTEYINPAIVTLAKKLKLPIALYNRCKSLLLTIDVTKQNQRFQAIGIIVIQQLVQVAFPGTFVLCSTYV